MQCEIWFIGRCRLNDCIGSCVGYQTICVKRIASNGSIRWTGRLTRLMSNRSLALYVKRFLRWIPNTSMRWVRALDVQRIAFVTIQYCLRIGRWRFATCVGCPMDLVRLMSNGSYVRYPTHHSIGCPTITSLDIQRIAALDIQRKLTDCHRV